MGRAEIVVFLVLICGPIWLIAFLDVVKGNFKGNDKIIWLLVVVFLPLLVGPLSYLFIGQKQKIKANDQEKANPM